MLQANITEFHSYSNFDSLKAFNNSIEGFLSIHKKDFTKAEYIAFRRLTKFCCKEIGLCNAKIDTIVKATEKDGQPVSRSSVKRAIAKAKKLGVLSVKALKRSNQSQSSNLYIFEVFSFCTSIEPPGKLDVDQSITTVTSDPESQPETQLNHLINYPYLKTNKTLKERKENPSFDHTYVSSNIPNQFIETVSPFYGDSDSVYHLWSRLTLATRKHGSESLEISHMGSYLKVFKESIYRLKQGKIKKDFYGYIYTVWARITQLITMEDNARNHQLYYDWLEA